MPQFVHLHVHSEYSLLDGLTKLEDLVEKAKEYNMPAVAVTDHGSLYAAFKFWQIAKDAGIKPIIGMEAYVARNGMNSKNGKIDGKPFHLVLLAKNEEGYKNLVKLTSEAHTRGFYYKPRIDIELLEKHSEGLIALSACIQGEVAYYSIIDQDDKAEASAKKYLEIFGPNNFFLELQHHPSIEKQAIANKKLIELSKKLGIGLVATNDSHYLNKDDNEAQDLLLCIQTKNTVNDEKRGLRMIDEDFSFRSPQEMAKDFAHVPEAISNTVRIAERCNFDFKNPGLILPDMPIPKGETNSSHLKKETYQGIRKLLKREPNEEEKRRLDYELKVITEKKLESYFFLCKDFTDFMHKEKIPTTTRGSAAGSFVSYALGITTANPLFFDLPFERFLNPLRPKPPDIDLDIADSERDKVINYAIEKYGKPNVAQIITFGRMKAKAAIRDVGRALDYPYDFCDKLAKLIPGGPGVTLKKALQEIPEFKQAYNTDPSARKVIDFAKKLEGIARHASVHAAGIVITPDAMTKYVPVQYDTDSSMMLTQFEMTELEEIGLVKMDFLGLSNLSTIRRAVKILEFTKNEKVDVKNLPLDNKKTYELLSKGETLGLFQVESAGMRRNLKQLKPEQIFDIGAMLALYRPGPMENIPAYIENKNNTDKISIIDKRMEPILEKSYGVITYQDDVLLIAIEVGGYDWETVDKFRKAMGKKIPKLMAEQKSKFIKGAQEGGMSRADAKKLFDLMEPFAGYGFGKAHAAAYSLVTYQTAYLKAHYPTEFMAALLAADQESTDRVVLEVNECDRLGIEVLPPSANESFKDFTVVASEGETLATSKTIRFGLAAIKNLGANVIEDILKARGESKFASIEDFIKRAYTGAMNRKSLEALIKSGAMDDLGERKRLLGNVDTLLHFAKTQFQAVANGQTDLFGCTEIPCPKLKLTEIPAADKKERLTWEKELLGLYVSEHPLSEYKDLIEKCAFTTNQLTESSVGKKIRIAAIITDVRNIVTKKNKPMAFVRIEDVTGTLEVVVFPNLFAQNPGLWKEDNMLLITGKVDNRDDELKILADSAQHLTNEINPEKLDNIGIASKENLAPKQKLSDDYLYIKVPENCSPDKFQEIKQALNSADKGLHKVALLLPKEDQKYQKLETNFLVKKDDLLKVRLEKVLGPGTVSK